MLTHHLYTLSKPVNPMKGGDRCEFANLGILLEIFKSF